MTFQYMYRYIFKQYIFNTFDVYVRSHFQWTCKLFVRWFALMLLLCCFSVIFLDVKSINKTHILYASILLLFKINTSICRYTNTPIFCYSRSIHQYVGTKIFFVVQNQYINILLFKNNTSICQFTNTSMHQ